MSDNTTTQKFGPQWLRIMTDCPNTVPPNSPGTTTSSSSPPLQQSHFKKAERRYGKEEMLDLYSTSLTEIPEDIDEFSFIFKKTAQKPLNYEGITEEEQRLMSQAVNSNLALRLTGRPVVSARGRGSERGRGRGRGRGDTNYNRDDESNSGIRTKRPEWDNDSAIIERSGVERPYSSRTTDDTSSGSPRKEYSRSNSENTDWRRRDNNDESDWRKGSRFNNTRGWREPRESRSRNFEHDGGGEKSYSRTKNNRDDDDLPEWLNDETGDGETQGTFDASGAFRSVQDIEKSKSSDEEEKESVENTQDESNFNKEPSLDQKENNDFNGAAVCSVELPINNENNVNNSTDTKNQSAIVEKNNVLDKKNSECGEVKNEDLYEDHARAAENLIASLNVEIEEKDISQDPDIEKWFYRDPQGLVQGPFMDSEMWEWYMAGYFTMDLQLRKGRSGPFRSLAQVMQAMNTCVPFGPQDIPRPILTPEQLCSFTPEQYKVYQMRQQDLQHKSQICHLMFTLSHQDRYKSMSAVDLQQLAIDTLQKQKNASMFQHAATTDPSIIAASMSTAPPPITHWSNEHMKQSPGFWDIASNPTLHSLFNSTNLNNQRLIQHVDHDNRKEPILERFIRDEEIKRKNNPDNVIEQLMKEEQERRRVEKLREEQQEMRNRQMETEELMRRQQLEEQKRKREMELEKQRSEEIRKRQERQQIEALRRANNPTNIAWGVQQNNGPIPLSTIQQIEAQQMENQKQQMAERFRQIEAATLAASASNKPWSAQSNVHPPKKTLLQIQQEQEKELVNKVRISSEQTNVSTMSSSSSNSLWNTQWARTGAWAKTPNVFDQPNQQLSSQANKYLDPVLKENMDFNSWTEANIRSINSNLDAGTFVSLLREIKSADDICDLLNSHLGNSTAVDQFANEYLARRSSCYTEYFSSAPSSQSKLSQKMEHPEVTNKEDNNKAHTTITTTGGNNKIKKGRKKMQKVDKNLLGFTCTADPDRTNAGEIENLNLS